MISLKNRAELTRLLLGIIGNGKATKIAELGKVSPDLKELRWGKWNLTWNIHRKDKFRLYGRIRHLSGRKCSESEVENAGKNRSIITFEEDSFTERILEWMNQAYEQKKHKPREKGEVK